MDAIGERPDPEITRCPKSRLSLAAMCLLIGAVAIGFGVVRPWGSDGAVISLILILAPGVASLWRGPRLIRLALPGIASIYLLTYVAMSCCGRYSELISCSTDGSCSTLGEWMPAGFGVDDSAYWKELNAVYGPLYRLDSRYVHRPYERRGSTGTEEPVPWLAPPLTVAEIDTLCLIGIFLGLGVGGVLWTLRTQRRRNPCR